MDWLLALETLWCVSYELNFVPSMFIYVRIIVHRKPGKRGTRTYHQWTILWADCMRICWKWYHVVSFWKMAWHEELSPPTNHSLVVEGERNGGNELYSCCPSWRQARARQLAERFTLSFEVYVSRSRLDHRKRSKHRALIINFMPVAVLRRNQKISPTRVLTTAKIRNKPVE